METVTFTSLVWLVYRLGATFALGLPFVLLIWSSLKSEAAISRLMSIYWKVASLMLISMLLLIGGRPIGYITSFCSPFLIICSIWFWIDLNEELEDQPKLKPLILTVRLWRWALTAYGCLYIYLSSLSLSCINSPIGQNCIIWQKIPHSLHLISQNIFSFLFGASWTQSLSSFVGYVAMIIYLIGLIQFLIVRIPKQGRIAGGF